MEPSIRVVLLTTTVDFGGIEKVVLTLFRHIDRDVEFFPIVFARTDNRDRTFLDQLEGLGFSPRMLYVNENRLLVLNPVRNVAETIAILRKERFDLIHSHGYRADLIALPLARYFGVPVVSTCHGFTSNDRRLSLYARLNVMFLRCFNRVIAVSARMRDDLVDKGLKLSRIDVIPNAVESVCDTAIQSARQSLRDRLKIKEDEFTFGFVGRLSEEKGLAYLLGALGRRPPAESRWRLLVVGDGPRRRELEESAAQAGLADHVVFAGFHSDASPWFSAMDAFVLPSLTEGTPMALLEAMAHRVPVIASAVGGVPAILSDRVNGLLVPPADTEALSQALCDLASDEELRRTLSRAGHETVRDRYDVRPWAAKTRSVYEQALQKR